MISCMSFKKSSKGSGVSGACDGNKCQISPSFTAEFFDLPSPLTNGDRKFADVVVVVTYEIDDQLHARWNSSTVTGDSGFCKFRVRNCSKGSQCTKSGLDL